MKLILKINKSKIIFNNNQFGNYNPSDFKSNKPNNSYNQ